MKHIKRIAIFALYLWIAALWFTLVELPIFLIAKALELRDFLVDGWVMSKETDHG